MGNQTLGDNDEKFGDRNKLQPSRHALEFDYNPQKPYDKNAHSAGGSEHHHLQTELINL